MVLLAVETAAISTVVIMVAAGAHALLHRRHTGRPLRVRRVRERYEVPDRNEATPSVADLRHLEERPRSVRDRGAQKQRRSIRHPTGHRR